MSQPESWIAYVRSAQRRGAATTCQQQEAAIRSVLPRGARVIVIAETGSGLTGHRPGLERLLALIRSGSISGVAAFDHSRLARDPGTLRTLTADMKAFGVELRLATHPHLSEAERTTLDDHLELITATSTRDGTPTATGAPWTTPSKPSTDGTGRGAGRARPRPSGGRWSAGGTE